MHLGVILCLVDIGNGNIMLMGCFIKGLERGGFLVRGLLDGFGGASFRLRSKKSSMTGSADQSKPSTFWTLVWTLCACERSFKDCLTSLSSCFSSLATCFWSCLRLADEEWESMRERMQRARRI